MSFWEGIYALAAGGSSIQSAANNTRSGIFLLARMGNNLVGNCSSLHCHQTDSQYGDTYAGGRIYPDSNSNTKHGVFRVDLTWGDIGGSSICHSRVTSNFLGYIAGGSSADLRNCGIFCIFVWDGLTSSHSGSPNDHYGTAGNWVEGNPGLGPNCVGGIASDSGAFSDTIARIYSLKAACDGSFTDIHWLWAAGMVDVVVGYASFSFSLSYGTTKEGLFGTASGTIDQAQLNYGSPSSITFPKMMVMWMDIPICQEEIGRGLTPMELAYFVVTHFIRLMA